MKKYLPVVAALLIVPSVTFASWWNPISWFKVSSSTIITSSQSDQISNNQPSTISSTTTQATSSVQCVPQIITKTTSVPDSSQQTLILSLETKIASLENQLTQKNGQTNPVSSTVTTPNPQSTVILTELATLNQIDLELDNDPMQIGDVPNNTARALIGTSTLLDVLNNSKKLDGTDLFPSVTNLWYLVAGEHLQPSTSITTLHAMVQAYRRQLQAQLGIIQGVNQNMDFPQ